jgi:hypothetical protein
MLDADFLQGHSRNEVGQAGFASQQLNQLLTFQKPYQSITWLSSGLFIENEVISARRCHTLGTWQSHHRTTGVFHKNQQLDLLFDSAHT